MAAITLIGAKVKQLSISQADGKATVTGVYELLSNEGKILAKQAYGDSYHGVGYTPSPETQKVLDQALTAVAKDLNTSMGFE